MCDHSVTAAPPGVNWGSTGLRADSQTPCQSLVDLGRTPQKQFGNNEFTPSAVPVKGSSHGQKSAAFESDISELEGLNLTGDDYELAQLAGLVPEARHTPGASATFATREDFVAEMQEAGLYVASNKRVVDIPEPTTSATDMDGTSRVVQWLEKARGPEGSHPLPRALLRSVGVPDLAFTEKKRNNSTVKLLFDQVQRLLDKADPTVAGTFFDPYQLATKVASLCSADPLTDEYREGAAKARKLIHNTFNRDHPRPREKPAAQGGQQRESQNAERAAAVELRWQECVDACAGYQTCLDRFNLEQSVENILLRAPRPFLNVLRALAHLEPMSMPAFLEYCSRLLTAWAMWFHELIREPHHDHEKERLARNYQFGRLANTQAVQKTLENLPVPQSLIDKFGEVGARKRVQNAWLYDTVGRKVHQRAHRDALNESSKVDKRRRKGNDAKCRDAKSGHIWDEAQGGDVLEVETPLTRLEGYCRDEAEGLGDILGSLYNGAGKLIKLPAKAITSIATAYRQWTTFQRLGLNDARARMLWQARILNLIMVGYTTVTMQDWKELIPHLVMTFTCWVDLSEAVPAAVDAAADAMHLVTPMRILGVLGTLGAGYCVWTAVRSYLADEEPVLPLVHDYPRYITKDITVVLDEDRAEPRFSRIGRYLLLSPGDKVRFGLGDFTTATRAAEIERAVLRWNRWRAAHEDNAEGLVSSTYDTGRDIYDGLVEVATRMLGVTMDATQGIQLKTILTGLILWKTAAFAFGGLATLLMRFISAVSIWAFRVDPFSTLHTAVAQGFHTIDVLVNRLEKPLNEDDAQRILHVEQLYNRICEGASRLEDNLGFSATMHRAAEHKLNELAIDARRYMSGTASRMKPVSLALMGPSGTGKTTAIDAILKLAYRLSYDEDTRTFTKTRGSPYADGYDPQVNKVVIVEEFMTDTSPENRRSDTQWMLDAISTSVYFPNMANCTDKGAIPFNSYFHGVTSNVTKLDAGAVQLADKMALYNRLHIIADVVTQDPSLEKQLFVVYAGKFHAEVFKFADANRLVKPPPTPAPGGEAYVPTKLAWTFVDEKYQPFYVTGVGLAVCCTALHAHFKKEANTLGAARNTDDALRAGRFVLAQIRTDAAAAAPPLLTAAIKGLTTVAPTMSNTRRSVALAGLPVLHLRPNSEEGYEIGRVKAFVDRFKPRYGEALVRYAEAVDHRMAMHDLRNHVELPHDQLKKLAIIYRLLCCLDDDETLSQEDEAFEVHYFSIREAGERAMCLRIQQLHTKGWNTGTLLEPKFTSAPAGPADPPAPPPAAAAADPTLEQLLLEEPEETGDTDDDESEHLDAHEGFFDMPEGEYLHKHITTEEVQQADQQARRILRRLAPDHDLFDPAKYPQYGDEDPSAPSGLGRLWAWIKEHRETLAVVCIFAPVLAALGWRYIGARTLADEIADVSELAHSTDDEEYEGPRVREAHVEKSLRKKAAYAKRGGAFRDEAQSMPPTTHNERATALSKSLGFARLFLDVNGTTHDSTTHLCWVASHTVICPAHCIPAGATVSRMEVFTHHYSRIPPEDPHYRSLAHWIGAPKKVVTFRKVDVAFIELPTTLQPQTTIFPFLREVTTAHELHGKMLTYLRTHIEPHRLSMENHQVVVRRSTSEDVSPGYKTPSGLFVAYKDHIWYNLVTRPGDCFNPVLDGHDMVGLHVAGAGEAAVGHALVISRSMLRSMLETVKPDMLAGPPEPTLMCKAEGGGSLAVHGTAAYANYQCTMNPLEDGDYPKYHTWDSIATMGPKCNWVVPQKTAYRPSPLFDVFFEQKPDLHKLYAPAPMREAANYRGLGVDVPEPLPAYLLKYPKPNMAQPYDPEALDRLYDGILGPYRWDTDVLSIHDALNGVPELYLSAVDRSTSGGHPRPDKSFYVTFDGEVAKPTEALTELIAAALVDIKTNRCFPFMYGLTAKDEINEVTTAEDGSKAIKTRFLGAGPFLLTMLARMFLPHFQFAVKETFKRGHPAACGLGVVVQNPTEWLEIQAFLTNTFVSQGRLVAPRLFDMDIKGEDRHAPWAYIAHIIKAVNNFYPANEEHRIIREVVLVAACRHFYVRGDRVIGHSAKQNSGVASGHPLTTIIDTLMTMGAMWQSFRKIAEDIGRPECFTVGARAIVYGDDDVAGVAPDFPVEKMAAAMLEVSGFTVTAADKTPNIRFANLQELSFLGRTFGHAGDPRRAPLALNTILRILLYTRSGDPTVVQSGLSAFEFELAQYGPKVYAYWHGPVCRHPYVRQNNLRVRTYMEVLAQLEHVGFRQVDILLPGQVYDVAESTWSVTPTLNGNDITPPAAQQPTTLNIAQTARPVKESTNMTMDDSTPCVDVTHHGIIPSRVPWPNRPSFQFAPFSEVYPLAPATIPTPTPSGLIAYWNLTTFFPNDTLNDQARQLFNSFGHFRYEYIVIRFTPIATPAHYGALLYSAEMNDATPSNWQGALGGPIKCRADMQSGKVCLKIPWFYEHEAMTTDMSTADLPKWVAAVYAPTPISYGISLTAHSWYMTAEIQYVGLKLYDPLHAATFRIGRAEATFQPCAVIEADDFVAPIEGDLDHSEAETRVPGVTTERTQVRTGHIGLVLMKITVGAHPPTPNDPVLERLYTDLSGSFTHLQRIIQAITHHNQEMASAMNTAGTTRIGNLRIVSDNAEEGMLTIRTTVVTETDLPDVPPPASPLFFDTAESDTKVVDTLKEGTVAIKACDVTATGAPPSVPLLQMPPMDAVLRVAVERLADLLSNPQIAQPAAPMIARTTMPMKLDSVTDAATLGPYTAPHVASTLFHTAAPKTTFDSLSEFWCLHMRQIGDVGGFPALWDVILHPKTALQNGGIPDRWYPAVANHMRIFKWFRCSWEIEWSVFAPPMTSWELIVTYHSERDPDTVDSTSVANFPNVIVRSRGEGSKTETFFLPYDTSVGPWQLLDIDPMVVNNNNPNTTTMPRLRFSMRITPLTMSETEIVPPIHFMMLGKMHNIRTMCPVAQSLYDNDQLLDCTATASGKRIDRAESGTSASSALPPVPPRLMHPAQVELDTTTCYAPVYDSAVALAKVFTPIGRLVVKVPHNTANSMIWGTGFFTAAVDVSSTFLSLDFNTSNDIATFPLPYWSFIYRAGRSIRSGFLLRLTPMGRSANVDPQMIQLHAINTVTGIFDGHGDHFAQAPTVSAKGMEALTIRVPFCCTDAPFTVLTRNYATPDMWPLVGGAAFKVTLGLSAATDAQIVYQLEFAFDDDMVLEYPLPSQPFDWTVQISSKPAKQPAATPRQRKLAGGRNG